LRAFFAVSLFIALPGCVTHVPLSDQYRGPQELPAATLATAVDDEQNLPIVASADEELKDRFRFTVRHITLPSSADPANSIDFEYYDVDGSGRTPVIVLLPIFNGQLMITRYFARYFANHGWAALVVVRERDPLDDLGDPEEAIRANLSDYRHVLDWVEQKPEFDSSRIGLFGVSFGAMDAIMLTALDERVDALVAAMAGGDLASVLTTTNYRRLTRRTRGMMEDTGMSREDLRQDLDDRITTDPLALAPYVDAERVLLIMTRTDAIVHFETQQALRASLGAPETLYLPTGHRPSVLYFPLVRSSAYEFFARCFADSPVALARN
jgi:pimeloyl-ACP methyl ester carboxylesterase